VNEYVQTVNGRVVGSEWKLLPVPFLLDRSGTGGGCGSEDGAQPVTGVVMPAAIIARSSAAGMAT
jgi:hypothetical protein